jgi:apoptosis-inducing factor 3
MIPGANGGVHLMAGPSAELSGPDLSAGVSLDALEAGQPLLGHAQGEAVLLTVLDGEPFAISATCSHYGGPLAEGLVDGDTVRCPWHHACFSLRTGEAVRPPALMDLPRWRTEQRDGRVFVMEKLAWPDRLGPRARCRRGSPSRGSAGQRSRPRPDRSP